MGGPDEEEVAPPPPPPPPPDEVECKICYQRYNIQNRRPKVLVCLHRVCARCLGRILAAADGGSLTVSCPFCRHETIVSRRQVSELPDDSNIMSRLATRDKSWSSDLSGELLLTPGSLTTSPSSSSSSPSRHSSNCLVITIVEVPGEPPSGREAAATAASELYTEQSVDSMSVGSEGPTDHDVLSKACKHVPRMLVWLLGFFYFSSLPLGIYLLVIQRVTLGVVCVSLVPSSLTVCLVYGFCQCLCQGVCDCSPGS
ncbi:E3 ubiquitin-protein ligase RNF182 [Merluccius polli]|uniref:E3 ubiquitin-protein ligase RNF182 n=1 Tax=Merluccius polli TaxID=89951 RepID=A0AA47M9U6_MERPO|nr:E3 ubiquitin-protein ligase RNF182 [Merluccius polli]